MTCRAVKTLATIPALNMEDGELGEVIEWPDQPNRIGQVLQRGGGVYLIVLGEPHASHFVSDADSETCRVRILHSGDTIRID